jgi:2OG-Fe(II) oxygenase superfamily
LNLPSFRFVMSGENEILIYARVSGKLDELVKDGIPFPMEMDSTLSEALDNMSCIPFIRFPVMSSYNALARDCAFTIAGAPAGTLGQPDIDLILQKSTPSPFGRGSENVMDPAYRSGREIPAADIGFTNNTVLGDVRIDVKSGMFPGRKVEAKLYKLAIYEPGGHFDWHMDSTHSDKHHATLLVALNTSWKGGDLVLRRNDIETHINLQPQFDEKGEPILQAVAFFTDTEHRVEPVTEGVRIVFQYDIEAGDTEKDPNHWMYEGAPWMDKVHSDYSSRMELQGIAQVISDEAAVEKVVTIITELHKSGVDEVAFAMQHLYRKAAISAQCLKGSDAVLYNALLASGLFDISLHPVVLRETSDYEGEIDKHYAYRADGVEMDTATSSNPAKKKKKITREFHIPKLSAIQKISSRNYVEHTGNEAMAAEYRYFGGGMFVRAK